MRYLFTLVLFFFVCVFGVIHGRTLAHRQPQFASITHEGMIYKCVNFYEQPAFDHPRLKHLVPRVRSNSSLSAKIKFNDVDGICPDGTVPLGFGGGIIPPFTPDAQVHCFAIVRTKADITDRKFYGTNVLMSYNRPHVEGLQWSASRLKLLSGYTPDSESIEAGWIAYPDYFKDNKAHLYTKFKTGGKECFNTDCPGFVQVSQKIALGSYDNHSSAIEGQRYMWNPSIEMSTEGNWELFLSSPDIGKEKIGYFPGALFTKINAAASQVEWGGEIHNPGPANPSPFMGTGRLPNEASSAFFNQVTVIKESAFVDNPDGTEEFQDCSELYRVSDMGVLGASLGRTIYFGGYLSE